MGVIRVKLANNYATLPQDAASNYASENKIKKLITPNNIVSGTWKIVEGMELNKGFGAIAKKTDGKWWGFSVCFLFNQSTGNTDLYYKHLKDQNTAGAISENYFLWFDQQANSFTLGDFNAGALYSVQDAGTFVHPAYLAVRTLNESSIQDEINIDFTYQSPLFPDQPNFYLNDTGVGIPLRKRTMQTSQRTVNNIPGTDQNQNEGFGAYGDNPWPKCSMMSFFSATAYEGNEEDILKAIGSDISDCFAEQETSWTQQWEDINAEPGPA